MTKFRPSLEYELITLPPTTDTEAADPTLSSRLVSKIKPDIEETALPHSTETTSSFGLKNTDRGGQPLRWPILARFNRYLRFNSVDDTIPPYRGWRKAVIAAAIVAGCVLLLNILFMIVVQVKFPPVEGIGEIYTGDCDIVKRWDTAIHLFINLLSTILLAASSFTMQCLSSPTRKEVDAAHAKKTPLDIGMGGITNLLDVKWWKGAVWMLLCLSTVPLHLLWNSTIFTTTSANLFSFVAADESFLQGASYLPPNDTALDFCYDVGGAGNSGNATPTNVINEIYDGYQSGLYLNLTAADCYDYYINSKYLTRQRNVIMIVQRPTTSVFMGGCGYHGKAWNGSSVVGIGINFFPGLYWPGGFIGGLNHSTSMDYWVIGNFTVTSCKSEITPSSSFCQLQVMSYILYTVVVCNLVKFICMCATVRYLWSLDEPILATIGDAVSSFLEFPDQTTRGFCLLDFKGFQRDEWKIGKSYNPIYRRKQKQRLYFATSHFRWWGTMFLCSLYLVLGFILWHVSFGQTFYSQSKTMTLEFGAVDAELLLGHTGASGRGLFNDILIANSFQLALSTTYFLYNSLYTAQCAALEWVSYVQGRLKSLRVTWPRGKQRSTYYLQLPYRYGIPLTTLLIVMHFLISQSVFLARLQYYDWKGVPFETPHRLIDDNVSTHNFTDVGFSPRATLTTCLVGLVLILAQIAHAFRPLDNRIPIHGNSSLVISAMCHCDPDTGTGRVRNHSPNQPKVDSIATKPLTWGVIREPVDPAPDRSTWLWDNGDLVDGSGHCSFSTDLVKLPQRGKRYR